MLRIIVQTADAGMAANVGGPVATDIRTFDVSVPTVEAFLSADVGSYGIRQVIGVELLRDAALTAKENKP